MSVDYSIFTTDIDNYKLACMYSFVSMIQIVITDTNFDRFDDRNVGVILYDNINKVFLQKSLESEAEKKFSKHLLFFVEKSKDCYIMENGL